MKTTKLFAVAALSAFAAFGAHADEADASQFSVTVTSTRSAAEVKAEALNPIKISNGSTGFVGVTQSGLQRSTVRAQAISALHNGEIPQGEIGYM
jgi:hypothetical protein